MAVEGVPVWLDDIISRLHTRDTKETHRFERLVADFTEVRERLFQLDLANVRLSRENNILERANQRLSVEASVGLRTVNSPDLEQKLLKLQDEVIDLHREREKLKGVINSNENHIKIQAEKINELNNLLAESGKINRLCMETIEKLKVANSTLLDEQTASALTVQRLEHDKKELIDDRNQYLAQISILQKQVEELKNSEYDMRTRLQRELIHRGLIDAACTPATVDERPVSRNTCIYSALPDSMIPITAADDVNCIRFSPSGNIFSYGGLDTKVWLCRSKIDKCDSQVYLVGCNAGVTAVDFDQEETMVLGASSDFACRVWSLSDRRLKVNLTGHSDRVLAARFMGNLNGSTALVTVSKDRTIKLWDIERRQCSRTIVVSSLCHDILPCTSSSNLISGHLDKKLRIWDQASGQLIRETLLSGRVTGLDLSRDDKYVLACTKNDSLYIIDLRQNEVLRSFHTENFHVHADFVRPCFSPDGTFVACGSENGSIFVWNANTGHLERILSGHENMVVCTHWSPTGNQIVSCERGKKICLWSRGA